MTKQFDVIVVGAGPAGLECAHTLKDSDLSVLILEKNESIGPKTCAGGIVGTVEPLDLPETKARSFQTLHTIIGTKKYDFNFGAAIKIIDRQALGQYQLGLLKDAGNVTIKTGTILRKIDKESVITNNGAFAYRCLVGADGSTSAVRRYLKIDSSFMMGIYYDIEAYKDCMVFYLNGKTLRSGYIWEFPHQNFTNIGFYFNPMSWKSKDALQVLKNHMRFRGYAIDPKIYRSFPINYLYKGSQFQGNIFLVGDAAGLASKLTGEGIAIAMISGREVARKIMNSDYDWKMLKAVVAKKKHQDRLAVVFEKIPSGLNLVYCIVLTALKFRVLSWSRYSSTGIS
jgi:geranylgeranyl reductase